MKRCLAFLVISAAITRSASADVVHQVRQGETLASIAERYYGDPARESTLVAANVLNAQANLSIVPGMRIMVPSVNYVRVNTGDTWERLAQHELGSGSRAAYLASVNHSNALVFPAVGAVIRVPYLLRWVVTTDEPLFEVARRFYGDRAQVQFILEFNHMSSARLQRGQVILLPLADVVLRDEPVCENVAPLAAANVTQRRVDDELPALGSLVAHGQYVEAVAMAARLAGAGAALSSAQRVAIDRALAVSYCAMERTDLAAEALRDALAADATTTFDDRTTPPKVMEAFALARGLDTVRTVAPAPPFARPEGAH